MMNAREDIVRRVARAPLRTIRTGALPPTCAHPRQEVVEFERRGLLHRFAHGIYCAVPSESDPSTWRPMLEAATAAIATALCGDRVPVLTAARVLGALPRGTGTGHVAVPMRRRPLPLADRDGEVKFVTRGVAALDAVPVRTDLGPVLATTAEQTVPDLARLDPRGEGVDAREVIATLWPECDPDVLREIAEGQRMRATLRRLAAAR